MAPFEIPAFNVFNALGIPDPSQRLSFDDIHRYFKEAMLCVHPDRRFAPPGAFPTVSQLSEAYHWLVDADQHRTDYHRLREAVTTYAGTQRLPYQRTFFPELRRNGGPISEIFTPRVNSTAGNSRVIPMRIDELDMLFAEMFGDNRFGDVSPGGTTAYRQGSTDPAPGSFSFGTGTQSQYQQQNNTGQNAYQGGGFQAGDHQTEGHQDESYSDDEWYDDDGDQNAGNQNGGFQSKNQRRRQRGRRSRARFQAAGRGRRRAGNDSRSTHAANNNSAPAPAASIFVGWPEWQMNRRTNRRQAV